jgi:type II secretory pathway predicted ATPase ExeA
MAATLVRTPAWEEASARLQFLVDRGARLGLLVGGAGVGKSLLLECFAEEQRAAGCLTAVVNAAGLAPEELLQTLADKLQTPTEPDWNLFRLWRAVNDRLLELRFLREQAVVLVDDAQLAGGDVLVHLYRLLHAEAAADARLTVVVASTTESVSRLGRSLLDLVDLRVELPAWSAMETKALINATSKQVRSIRFTDEAVERIWELTGGMPRGVIRLAELCRLAAEADGGDCVDFATVDGVRAAFVVQPAAA